ncbi:hypothetical protein COMA2_120072 [Candidatus Nitrospira nitrificans]|uniref:Uncharacterized protein n=1 Tax=Candidatus Nitrospira nitrificans TaxID=1742973 RepID=A0A0S4L8Z3_9BACT|nr:hypothetical protein COMA2_120072 [Candidatus Nitrospira nitrificans]
MAQLLLTSLLTVNLTTLGGINEMSEV